MSGFIRPLQSGDVSAIAAGVVGWAVFALFLHDPLIGVRPFG
ncbi:conserved hypothetical protein [Burkholderia cenocepacia HI2424]|uniref:Uncharacterized protein n=1 Tax=Burkholderia orbicola (strain AU 1054) TaxID=331271 RepID=A0A0H2XZ46_BURO1|nr:conserved hypothetical protein [Burkholderia cenocepacia HI2424]NTX49383.1 hypothetical protein [Burkholderia cepacia]QCY09261.1 hypothetical protein EJ998_40455 [Burkholderia cepacia ATCC 25416]QIY39863.1 hypothetical protein FOC28_09205 [Burkholderia cenocepacia]RQU44596.1 hypothetical protein DF147_15520 [Burkholderia cenocepacia]